MSTPQIVLTDAKPLVDPDGNCPRCRAGVSERVPSAGFGNPHEVCRKCGYEFPEAPRG